MLQMLNPISIKIQYPKKLNVQNVHTNENNYKYEMYRKLCLETTRKIFMNLIEGHV